MEEDLPHPDPESQYSGTNAHLEMLKDMLMTYNMYDQKKVGMSPEVFLPLVGLKFYRPAFDSLLYVLPADTLNLCFLVFGLLAFL